MTEPVWKDQFKEAKVGDRVWHIRHGWATIKAIYPKLETVEAKIDYDSGGFDYITCDGKHVKHGESEPFPSVFWGPIELKEIPQQPKRLVKKKIEGWANIYSEGESTAIHVHTSLKRSDRAGFNRLGDKAHWVSFEYEVEE